MDMQFVGSADLEKPDHLRFPRLEESDRAVMVEVWNDEMYSFFPKRKQIRIQIGKRLFLIKGIKGYRNYGRWFKEQDFEFGPRTAEKYMDEAKEHYKNNTNNYSYCPVPITDEVHAETAKKKGELGMYQFILYDRTPEEIQRLKRLRKSQERVKAHTAVIKALQPWLKGDRVAHPPA